MKKEERKKDTEREREGERVTGKVDWGSNGTVDFLPELIFFLQRFLLLGLFVPFMIGG